MPPVVALLSDFGLQDPFVGVMKGVLLDACPEARLIDLTHEVPPQDVRAGAFALKSSVPYFGRGVLFVCVVDPGVGSSRRILWARSARHSFLAPDNGLLSWAALDEPFVEVRELTNRRLFLEPVSATFHGRDKFAPAAGALCRGLPPSELGPEAKGWKRLPFPAVRRLRGRSRGVVLAVDRFGNAVTNLTAEHLGGGAVRFKGEDMGRLRASYSSVAAGKPAALLGSAGFVELSVREGSFARAFGARPGDPVEGIA